MTIFAIIPQPSPTPSDPGLGQAVADEFKEFFYTLGGGHGWLVAVQKRSAKEISDLLGITDGKNGAAIVFEIASYFGRANPSVWNWIQANWDAPKS